MQQDIKQNFIEKNKLIITELSKGLGKDIESMYAKQSMNGVLRSGMTVKNTMDLIVKKHHDFYQAVLAHLGSRELNYYLDLESDIQNLIVGSENQFRKDSLICLKKSTEMMGKPELFERILPELDNEMALNTANFNNTLNAVVLDKKFNSSKSTTIWILWGIEGALLLITIFISGMWYSNPIGNYEPIVVGLASMMSLLGLVIRFRKK